MLTHTVAHNGKEGNEDCRLDYDTNIAGMPSGTYSGCCGNALSDIWCGPISRARRTVKSRRPMFATEAVGGVLKHVRA